MESAQAILDGAERLVDRGEYEASVRAVAREAGTGASTIYEYFESRDHLFAAALARRIDRDALDPTLLDAASTLETLIASVVAQRIQSTKAHPSFTILAAQLSLGRHGDSAIREGYRAAVATFAPRLGRYDLALTANEAARLIIAGIEGALLAATEERPQYLDDPSFATELTWTLAGAVRHDPVALPRTRAQSNATREWRPRSAQREMRRIPRQERARVLVDTILRGAERIIDRRGVEDATTPAIAEAAGVSIGSLYQYFRDRDSVLAGVIDWWIEHDLALIRKELAKATEVPFQELYVNGMARFHELNVRFLAVYRAIFTLLPRLGRYQAAQAFLARGVVEVAADVAKRPDASGVDASLTTFVVGHIWVAWVRRFIATDPTFFASDAFRAALLRFGRAATIRMS